MTLKRLLQLAVLLPLALVLITFIVANREVMVLDFNPFAAGDSNWQVRAPVFVFLFAFLAIGVVLGSVTTWIGQHKYRKAARRGQPDAPTTGNNLVVSQENGEA